MTWLLLSTEDVLDGFTPVEQQLLERIQDSTARLANHTARAAAEFRQAISDAGTSLGSTSDGYLPPGFTAHAAALARWRWLISLPQAKALQTPERKEAAEKADTLIADIASGKRPVAAPDATTGGVAGPSFGERGGSATNDPPAREFTRTNQDG